MKKLFVLALLLCLTWITDCGVVRDQQRINAANQTRQQLKYLEVGMSKQKVEELLSEPYKVEMTVEGTEYWLYMTEPPAFLGDRQVSDRQLTPVAFREGKVIGWGRNFYQTEPNRIELELKK